MQVLTRRADCRQSKLYTDGIVGPIWSRVTQGREQHPSRVIMRDDDDLWYGETGQRERTSTTRRRKGGGDGYLQVRDDGALIIKSDGLTLWSSDEKKAPLDPWEPITTPVAKGSNKLRAGERIPVTSNIVSKNGQLQAYVSEQNNLTAFRKVGNGERQWLWSSNLKSQWVSRVALSWTGELVIYGPNGKRHWPERSANTDGSAELTMQDDGNLILSRDGNNRWSSDTPFPASIKRVDRLRYGEWLAIDRSLTSENGQYTLTFQPNASFCIIRRSDNSKTVTRTAPTITGAQLMCVGKDSNDLVIYNKDGKQTQRDGKVLWKAGSTEPLNWAQGAPEFILHNDGNAIFRARGQMIWAALDNLAAGSSMAGWGTTDYLNPGQKLKFGQTLSRQSSRAEDGSYTFGIDQNGGIFIDRAKGSATRMWSSGSDTAVPRTAWKSLEDERTSVDVFVFERRISSPTLDGKLRFTGKEKCVDTSLVADAVAHAYTTCYEALRWNEIDKYDDTMSKNRTTSTTRKLSHQSINTAGKDSESIIVSGDKDISPAVGHITRLGFPVSVWGWEDGMTHIYEEEEQFSDVRVNLLDEFMEDISYQTKTPDDRLPEGEPHYFASDNDNENEWQTPTTTRTQHRRNHSSPSYSNSFTKRCAYRRYCQHGTSCTFQHTQVELQQFTNSKPLKLRKNVLCDNQPCWRTKERCNFAHGREDLFCPTCEGSGHVMEKCHLA